MLTSAKKLEGFKIAAIDDIIGKAYDFFFDDNTWTVRYLVADTGGWLPGKRVLISPFSLGKPNFDDETIPVNLTKNQIENSPDVDEHMPIERQKEIELTQYYGWPNYWTGFGDPLGAAPLMPAGIPVPIEIQYRESGSHDSHLHSTRSIIDLNIQASDDSVGHVEDFIIDDDNWSIRYLIADTRNWLPGGKKVILSPRWISKMDWMDSKVHVDLTRDQILKSPEWDPSSPPDRKYEEMLHEHYGKKTYW